MPRSFESATAVAAPTAGAKSAGDFADSMASITLRAPARTAAASTPARDGRQQPDVRQTREAAADAGVMLEHGNAEGRKEITQPICLAGLRRLRDAQEHLRDLLFDALRLDRRQSGNGLRERFGRAA